MSNAREPSAARALWPEGFEGALALTFDLDAESVMLAADPAHASRASLMSHLSTFTLTRSGAFM